MNLLDDDGSDDICESESPSFSLRKSKKSDKTTSLPDGFKERSAEWHFEHFVEFTQLKQEIGEPSPHLAIVGWLSKDQEINDRLWLLGCYAATYCLPTAQVLCAKWSWRKAHNRPQELTSWLEKHWKGIVTRTERRCVRTPKKMAECLTSYLQWMRNEYPRLLELKETVTGNAYYDAVWESVEGIKFFGRYINIRLVEGLKRYCDIPARLYDIRSIGGWSPKKCLCYLYPEHASVILIDNAEGNALTDELAYDLLQRVRDAGLPQVDEYVLAAMLCEYKGAFEKLHQYTSWTVDQEPLLHDKVLEYWGNTVDLSDLWNARAALFPHEVLGEFHGWNGTRWDCAKTLQQYGYNWADLRYSYPETLKSGDFSNPVLMSSSPNLLLS